jgi:glycosyltransferase involved in cell wall biosynthesis
VNAAHFDLNSPSDRAAAAKLRAELGYGAAAKILLFAGKLVPGKQPVELLRAFLKLRRSDAGLVFVGDGPEKEELQRLSTGEGAANVRFLPFANQSEMPSRYLLADAFVLPSLSETWGLAVNESMHMGVPCVVSDRVGCQRDLVTHRETGWVFKAGDAAALEQALSAALDDVGNPSRRDEIVAAVAARISHYTYAQTTDGLLAALGSAEP